jgi:hypothetical protein
MGNDINILIKFDRKLSKKSGYKIYHTPKEKRKAHAKIMNECMMLDSESLLMVLGVDAKKEKNIALNK